MYEIYKFSQGRYTNIYNILFCNIYNFFFFFCILYLTELVGHTYSFRNLEQFGLLQLFHAGFFELFLAGFFQAFPC